MKEITIFTDGSSRGNPGPGGWGAIIADNINVIEIGGGEKNTTNNRMEMTAVIRALEYLSKPQAKSYKPEATIYTDSSYIVNGITKWVFGWQKNNWKTKTKQDVLNKDLWQTLVNVIKNKHISWELIKGHSGIEANERCDVIATSFADGLKPKFYSSIVSNYPFKIFILGTSLKAKSQKLKTKSSKKPAYSYVSSINGVVKIHNSWEDCERRVKGISGALYKKSINREDEIKIIKKKKKKNK
mgnify:CR=1 FL=1